MTWYDPAWTRRKAITIEADEVSADLTDFPVYVRFENDADLLANARPDGFDVLFTASDGETKLAHDVAWQGRLNRDGLNAWFGFPRSVYGNGYTFHSFMNKAGDRCIGRYVHATGAWTEFVLSAAVQDDDHNSGSVLRMGNGKVLAVYGKHNDTEVRARISTNADDISAFGTEFSIHTGGGIDYCSLIMLTGESNRIYCFFQANNGSSGRSLYYRTSNDNGATWSSVTELAANGAERPYWHAYPSGGDTIHFVISAGHPDEVTNNLYHFSMSGGALSASDGTAIAAALPIAPSDGTLVYNATASGFEAWNYDIRVDGSGNPVIVLAEMRTYADHRARYARWNGSSWTTSEIASMGGNISPFDTNYSGGVTIDDADPDVVYVSEVRSGRRVIVRRETSDGGSTWDAGTVISQTSNMFNIRPYSPWGRQSELLLTWACGRYRDFDHGEFDIGLQTYPSIVKAVDAQYLVKIPSLSGSVDTVIYMYFGNAAASSQADAANAKDASTLLQAFGDVSQINIGSPDLHSLAAMTLETWFQPSVDAAADAHIVSNWTTTTKAECMIRVAYADTGNPMECFVRTTAASVGRTFTDIAPTLDVPNYAALLYDSAGGGLKCHLNGALSAQAQASANLMNANAAGAMWTGQTPHQDRALQGDIRLVVVSNVRRSDDYLTTRHNNLSDPATFYAVGMIEENGAGDVVVPLLLQRRRRP